MRRAFSAACRQGAALQRGLCGSSPGREAEKRRGGPSSAPPPPPPPSLSLSVRSPPTAGSSCPLPSPLRRGAAMHPSLTSGLLSGSFPAMGRRAPLVPASGPGAAPLPPCRRLRGARPAVLSPGPARRQLRCSALESGSQASPVIVRTRIARLRRCVAAGSAARGLRRPPPFRCCRRHTRSRRCRPTSPLLP